MVAFKRRYAGSSKSAKNYRSVNRRLFKGKSNKVTNVRQMWPAKPFGSTMLWDPFPAKVRATLRYSQVINITPSTGTAGFHNFAANGIFDPDISTVGHQPFGRDTYATIYNHYSVLKSSISMAMTSPNNGIYGILLNDDASGTFDYDAVRENKTSKYTITNGQGQAPTVIQNYVRNVVFPGPSQNLQATMGGDPTERHVFQCWYEANTPVATASTTYFVVNITYEVEMWELKDLEIS